MIKSVMHTRTYRSHHQRLSKRNRANFKQKFLLTILGLVAVYITLFSVMTPAYSLSASNELDKTLPAQPLAIQWPTEGQAAIGAIGYGTLETHNITASVPTASVIKVVTALSVLQKHPLSLHDSGPALTMTAEDVARYEDYVANHGSVVPIREGQKLSEYQMIEAMLVKSANNLADSLAIWAFGSLKEYRSYATTYLKQLGMSHTTIGADASGLNPNSRSTASDLIILGQVAMRNPVIAEIVGKRSINIPEVGTVESTNTLLGTDGIVGIKTGTDYQDKGSYLFASIYRAADNQPPITILGAVMAAPSSPAAKQAALAMLRTARGGFKERRLFTANQTIAQYTPEWSSQPIDVTVKQDVRIVDWYAHSTKVDIDLNQITDEHAAGDFVGVINVETSTGRRVVARAVLKNAITKPSLWWRLTHPAAIL